jgi:hypothetical protein
MLIGQYFKICPKPLQVNFSPLIVILSLPFPLGAMTLTIILDLHYVQNLLGKIQNLLA